MLIALASEVRHDDIGILVHLVRVIRHHPHSTPVGESPDHILRVRPFWVRQRLSSAFILDLARYGVS